MAKNIDKPIKNYFLFSDMISIALNENTNVDSIWVGLQVILDMHQ